MTKQRASLGFADALDDFNPDEWAPQKPKHTKKTKVETSEVDELTPSQIASKAASAAGFKSREPKTTTPIIKEQAPKEQVPLRRRRTGRNAQFNLKAKPETIEAFCAIADSQDWGLGETLEKAVALLEREYKNK